MKITQAAYLDGCWQYKTDKADLKNPLVLVFANRTLLENRDFTLSIRNEFSSGHIIYCSTAGEIAGTKALEGSAVVTAAEFEKASFVIRTDNIARYNKNSTALGESLYQSFPAEGLRHIIVLSEGSFVNGSALIQGMENKKQAGVSISGGLCGDDGRFQKTLVGYNHEPRRGEVVAIGLYGTTLEVTAASAGGWYAFGPMRIITKSEGNVLYEIDGKPALELYRNYLGERSGNIAESSLLYPLQVTYPGRDLAVVRTILNIDEENNAMILAGDVPEQSKVQLMMASIDDLAEGAREAALQAAQDREHTASLALLISCVGRRLAMGQRVEEELEQVQEVLGPQTVLNGMYSYGEIAPTKGNHFSELHNQTMTLTLISE